MKRRRTSHLRKENKHTDAPRGGRGQDSSRKDEEESLLSLQAGAQESLSRDDTDISESHPMRGYWIARLIFFLLIVSLLWFKTLHFMKHQKLLEREETNVLSEPDSTQHDMVFNESENVFESCRIIDSKTAAMDSTNISNHSCCSYFRPVKFFQSQQPGFEFQQVIAADYPSVKFDSWSWQVNNWLSDATTPLQLPYTSRVTDVESVTAFTIPKTGSRTQWQLFLDYLTPPKNPRNRKRRVGSVTQDYLSELKSRQEEQRSLRQKKDVVYAVIRDPVSRFLSSLGQLISMRRTRRCQGCNEYLEPCLTTAHSEIENKRDIAASVVQCIVETLKEHGFWNEHLIPSAVFLTRPLGNFDIELAVFDLSSLNRVASTFGVRDPIRQNQRKSKGNDNETTELVQDMDDLRMEEKTAHHKLIQDVCRLYAVDVSVRHYLGFSNTHCS